MHYHLDPLGGIAGDMFVAAMLDCYPAWQPELAEAIRDSRLSPALSVEAIPHNDGVLVGHRFAVHEPQQEHQGDSHQHHHWRDIRALLQSSRLAAAVKDRAIAIFERLAKAEAEVHGKPVDEVAFHEVGAWDSIADIVSAAWLVERSGASGWSCSPIPLGRGRIDTAHGKLPVPAPATTVLLQGYPVFDDGVPGERVTPTGAAILRHLNPQFGPRTDPTVLRAHGYGFGTKQFGEFSNVLRVSVFDTPAVAAHETVAVCQFEVDDQTAEDLAVAIEHLRAMEGVTDVIQSPVYGKKGRLCTHLQVLARVSCVEAVIDRCLIETTTLGVRWHTVHRTTLAREVNPLALAQGTVRVKRALRPDGTLTRKAEMTDLVNTQGGHRAREQRRREATDRDEQAEISDTESNK